jgi:hypothetical protein
MFPAFKKLIHGISLVACFLVLPQINSCGGGSSSPASNSKTTPSITWATPAAITYGTALSTTQLDATASVAGTFTYLPVSGAVISAGSQTLSVTFTPTDTTDYNTATASVSLVVNKATPTITWPTPAAVSLGTVLGSTQLEATASYGPATIQGSFAYTPVSGTVLSTAGTQTLSTIFTPSDTTDFNNASDSVSLTVTGSTAPSYSWGNVKIIAGGYVPAIYFHPTQQNLRYLRTDMGGAYRWGPNDTQWVPLFDWISPSNYWYGGAEAIGLDPTDANRLYVAVGEYASPTTASWDGNGAMMVSDDQGATFTTVPLSFKNGSNDDGRNSGERIAVDPNLPATVYFGARTAGLQISKDHGATWNKVTGLNVTTTANNSGIVSVVPVSSSGSSGTATPVVYVGVAGTGLSSDPVGLYVSTNAGTASSTFTAVAGQPTFTSASALAPLHAVLGPNGHIYVLYADGAGPNNISTSQLWEFTPTSGTWTSGVWRQITLPPNAAGNTGESGYGGIDCDPSKTGVLLLSTIDQWYPGDTIYRSTDNGTTWKDVSRTGGTHNASLSPYLTFGSGSVTNVGSGNWVGKVSIDPFNSDHIYYGTGATIWTTTSMTTADSGNSVPWTVGGNGVEENSVGMVLAPPSGNTILLSGMGDIYGFAHTDLTKSPAQGMYTNPQMYPSDMDFEQNTPTTVVRVTNGTAPYGVFSSDGGMTWSAFASNPTGTAKGGGTVAVAPDGSSIVWATADTNSVWFSTNSGATWTAASGIPAQAQVVSDRVKPGVYYGYSGTTLYTSINNGATWTTTQVSLPSGGTLVILPDVQGNLYLSTGSNGLYANTGSAGAPVLTKSSSVTASTYFHFGKAASGASHLTLFLYGQVNSVTGLFRSVDNGVSWIQINDAAHQWGGGINALTGDMRTFGTVYISTNGRGIIWGTSSN